MNKWRLLLSVLGLLQSASAERDFFDGRDRYRSDTRLSIQELHRTHKDLHEPRQLNVPGELNYGVREAELIRAPAIRHHKHRELYWQTSQQNGKSLLTDHRKIIEEDQFRANVHGNRREYRQRSNERHETSLVDVNRNRIIKENGDIRYSENSRSTRNNVQLNNIPLRRTEFYSRDRRSSNRRIEVLQASDVRNDRGFGENRNARRELLRENGERDFRRREVRQTEARNTYEQLNSRQRDEFHAEIDLKHENIQETDASRTKIDARGFSALHIRTGTNNVMASDPNQESNIREKRSIDSRLSSSARFFRENREMRQNIRAAQRSSSINNLDNNMNHLNNRIRSARHVVDLTETRDQDIASDRGLTYKMGNTMNSREERAKNEIHIKRNIREENVAREVRFNKDARERATHERHLIRSTREEIATNQIQRNGIQNGRIQNRQLLLSTEEKQERKHQNERNTRVERRNIPRAILESSERQYSISRLPSTDDIRQGISRSLFSRRLANSNKQSYTIRSVDAENGYTNVREERRKIENRDISNIREIRNRNTREGKQNEIQLSRNVRENIITNEVQRTRNVPDETNNMRRSRSYNLEERTSNEIRFNRNIRDRATNEIRLLQNIREASPTNQIRERDNNGIRMTRNYREERASNQIRRDRDVRERDINDIRLTRNAREERATNEIRNRKVRERDDNHVRLTTIRHIEVAREERTPNEIRLPRNIREDREVNELRSTNDNREGRRANKIRNNRNVRDRDTNDDRLTRKDSEERANNEIHRYKNIHNRNINEIRLTRNVREDGVPNELRISEKRATKDIRPTRNAREERSANEITLTRNTLGERARHEIRLSRNLHEGRSTNENRRARNSKDRATKERDINELRPTRIALQERTTNEIRVTENTRKETTENELRINRNLARNAREERTRDEIWHSSNTREERAPNNIRSTRNNRDERAINELRNTPNAKEHNRNTRGERDERTTNKITLTSDIRDVRETTKIQRSRITRDITNENRLKHNTRKDEIQRTLANNEIRQFRNARETRIIDGISRTRNNREEITNIRQQRQNIRKERNTKVNRNIRKDATLNETHRPRELKGINEIRQLTSTRDARITNIRFTLNGHEERANTIQRRHNTREESASDINIRNRNSQERTLSNTRRVLARDTASRRTVDSDNIRETTRLSTERIIDERIGNLEREYVYRNEKYSKVQFPANPTTVINAEEENTLVLKWQYLLYLLQGIYLCSLFMKFPKHYGEAKKTRAADWFATKNYLKID